MDDEYAAVYKILDMASPWTPGRFRRETLHDWIGRHLEKDLEYCKKYGIRYQPVMASYTEEVPIPHSNGPVYWRNGFEKRKANLKLKQGQWQDSSFCNIDVCDAHAKVLYQEAVQLETAVV